MSPARRDVLQGTLDLLVLRALALGPLHGLGVARRLEQLSRGVFRVNPGTFFPALYRLEERGFVKGEWQRSENNRRARCYSLTRAGRTRLAEEARGWRELAAAIERVLAGEPA
jgi:PadR family transcriptional regulator